MTITALPTAPDRDDPTTFSARSDAFLAALPDFGDECNATATTCNNNAISAASSASTASSASSAAQASQSAALASANSSAAAAGAALWVSGTSYSIGAVVWSPTTLNVYRCTAAVSGTTDPGSDGSHWALGATDAPALLISSSTSNTMVANQHIVLTNASVSTATLPAGPAAGTVCWVTVGNARTDNIVARNSQPIMGLAENLTIDSDNATIMLRYVDGTLGWRVL